MGSESKDCDVAKKEMGARCFSLQTYFWWLCLIAVVFMMITCPDLDASFSDSYRPTTVLVLPHALEARIVEDQLAKCAGRKVYMYELPSKFNTKLAEACTKGLIPWVDLCPHFRNAGFGSGVAAGKGSPSGEWADWYATDAYMLEVIFHARMQTYPCRINDPKRADAFFIPWYSGLDALPWLYNKRTTVLDRGRFGAEVLSWLERNAGEWWTRHGGRDHFLVLGRRTWDFSLDDDEQANWGTGWFGLPNARNMTSLMLERKPGVENEQAIPYPTSFHPSSPQSLRRWIDRVRNSKREFLMTYVGGIPSGNWDAGVNVGMQCDLAGNTTCNFVDCIETQCSHNPVPIVSAFLQSDFCLQPRGETGTRRFASAFDCMISGSIPVFFHEDTAYSQYLWHLPHNRSSYSVFIPEDDVKRGVLVKSVLREYSSERIIEMRTNILTLLPRLVYGNYANDPDSGAMDAFEVSIAGVLEQIAARKNSSPTEFSTHIGASFELDKTSSVL